MEPVSREGTAKEGGGLSSRLRFESPGRSAQLPPDDSSPTGTEKCGTHAIGPRTRDHLLRDEGEASAGNQCDGCNRGYEAECLMPLHTTGLRNGHTPSHRFPVLFGAGQIGTNHV